LSLVASAVDLPVADLVILIFAGLIGGGFAFTVVYSFVRLWWRLRNDDVEVSHRFMDAFVRNPSKRRRRRS
jgi:hypothetical protein